MNFEQLALGITGNDRLTFNSFVPDNNFQLFTALLNLLRQDSSKQCYIYGAAGSGKSHLLYAVINQAFELNKRSLYIDFAEFLNCDPKILAGVEYLDLLCIDNISKLPRNSVWLEALTTAIKQMQKNGRKLLVADQLPLSNIKFEHEPLDLLVADFASYKVNELTDPLKVSALQFRARLKGLFLSSESANFLRKRFSNATKDLFKALDLLDRESLKSKRKLTIPFIKRVIGI